jgi:hypothetical protein
MSGFISKEVQVIASAFRQALEMEPNPGNSVNATDNPHQVALIGRFSIYKAAERVWEMLKQHLEAEQKALEAKIKEAIAKAETGAANAPYAPAGAATSTAPMESTALAAPATAPVTPSN